MLTSSLGESVIIEAKALPLDKLIKMIGDKPSCDDLAQFIYNNYDKVTGLRKSMRNDEMDFPEEIVDLVDQYGFDIDEFTDCYGMAAESVSNESIDVKYWSDYNTDTSGQGQKEHEVKSKDFEDTFEDAVVYWNQEADGAENRIKGAQIQKIKKLAEEFFKKAGWISSNVIQAMIAQEAY